MKLLDKLLVANRGEIALRIIKSAKKLGIKTVAIYTESDRESGYLLLADEKVSLGEDGLNATYLNIDKIIGIALSTGSRAIHPGYGFLSESPDLARACEENQLIFIGPGSEVLELMGNKPEAKRLAANLGIPVAISHKIEFPEALTSQSIEFPAIIKSSYGGGGKGMKIVSNMEELTNHAGQTSRTAKNYFGNGTIFAEKLIRNARHVEVQLLGDQHGQLIHLFERECSIQRNHQKIIEEAPAIFLSAELRKTLLAAALRIGNAVHYRGAGTVEFLVDESGNYFFIEVNPRIQVEHAVTEEVTGIDIVSEQLKIASGMPLSFTQEEITVKGHAIEVRVYAEDPANAFTPSTDELLYINLPEHPDLRIEADLNLKHPGGNQFDPLLLKLIARSADRSQAIHLLTEHIGALNVIGPETNTKYLETILAHNQYHQNQISAEWCKNNHQFLIQYRAEKTTSSGLTYLLALAVAQKHLESNGLSQSDLWNYLGHWRLSNSSITLTIDGQSYHLLFNVNDRSNPCYLLNGTRIEFRATHLSANSLEITIDKLSNRFFYLVGQQGELFTSLANTQHHIAFPGVPKDHSGANILPPEETGKETLDVISPMHGKILEIYVRENQLIKKNDPLLVIEAMKSENKILSHKDAKVRKIAVHVGAQVTDRMPLIFLEELR